MRIAPELLPQYHFMLYPAGGAIGQTNSTHPIELQPQWAGADLQLCCRLQ